MLRPEDFFDLSNFAHRELFADCQYVWEALQRLKTYITDVIRPGIHGTVMDGAYLIGDHIQLGRGAIIEPGAYVTGPTIIGENSVIRHGAYIRGNVVVGNDCVVGHASELKGTILLNGSGAPHFNYAGDSILGNRVNLGAGTKLSNLKIIAGTVKVRVGDTVYDSGLRKFGAILGDHAQTSCNSVLNPGTLLGCGSMVYPNATITGYVPPQSIVKLRQTLETVVLKAKG